MTQQAISGATPVSYRENLQQVLAATPCITGDVGMAKAPAVVDVMGGICEDSGSLVLTATSGMSFAVSIWRVAGTDITVRLKPEGGRGPGHDVCLPASLVAGTSVDARQIISQCKASGGEWAGPVFLTLQRAAAEGFVSPLPAGLMVFVQTDFPPDVDLGRTTVLSVATLEALMRLAGKSVERSAKARLCSDAAEQIGGMQSVRTAITALAGLPDGTLLQIRFHPQLGYEPLPLPAGILFVTIRTTLLRPVSRQRMLETRLCTEMGQRVIQSLHNQDVLRAGADRLSAISPVDYVAHYRDVIPQKITGALFQARFGPLRGLNGDLDLAEIYKVRSRAEHHVYESLRVQDFVAAINRARRTGAAEALIEAGEKMFASHWSHSQRCGIGGVEPDQFISCVKAQGAARGLYGAKVTGGGAGGEMVVLMRDDSVAHAALAKAIAEAEALSKRTIHTYRGSLAGAELATA
jgi:L-arabinokinase